MLMRFLRSSLFALLMFGSTVPWGLAIIVLAPFTSYMQRYAIAKNWARMVMHCGGHILGIKNRIQGWDNLPGGSEAVLLVKHQSTWETFLMLAIMPRPLAFVFKKELLYLPFFGWAIGLLDMIYIDRSKRRLSFQKVIEQGKAVMQKGHWVIFFPEGTRIARGQAGTYKAGGVHLACAAGAPVIPIAVTSARVWPKNTFLKFPGVVDVSIGRPIASEGRDPHALIQEVQGWIEGEMRRLDASAYTVSAAAR